jgi:hypothetical protein
MTKSKVLELFAKARKQRDDIDKAVRGSRSGNTSPPPVPATQPTGSIFRQESPRIIYGDPESKFAAPASAEDEQYTIEKELYGVSNDDRVYEMEPKFFIFGYGAVVFKRTKRITPIPFRDEYYPSGSRSHWSFCQNVFQHRKKKGRTR